MTVHTGRHFLQIPGPTNVPDRVLRAMDMPPLDHRGAEFAELGYAVLAGMQRIFRTKQPVIIFPSSGTGASPHMSGDFFGWAPALLELFVVNFQRWRQGQPLLNVVDKQLGYIPSQAAGAEPAS